MKKKFSKKDVARLIRSVQTLNLEIPPNASDPQWRNIDQFLRKPAGSSILKVRALISKYYKESAKTNSNWIFMDQMKAIASPPLLFSTKLDSLSEISGLSVFNMTSISQQSPMVISPAQDPDFVFLLQLLPNIKQLDCKSKSIFKLQTLTLVHNLKYNEMF